MEVIALSGRSESGKTPTMHLVHNKLGRQGYTQVPGAYIDLGHNDFFDVLEKGTQVIGIVSRGDYHTGQYSLHNYLKRLESLGCSKSICACRVRGGTKDIVRTFTPHYIIRKTIVFGSDEEKDKINDADADRIVSII